MGRVCTLALTGLLFVSASSFAQDDGAVIVQRPLASAKRAVPQGSVVGHVFLADTHTPARGARIMLLPIPADGVKEGDGGFDAGQQQMATTALDGSFLLPHIPPGQYMVLAFAAGYLSPVDGVELSVEDAAGTKELAKKIAETAPIARINGQETARVDIDLQRGAVLSGRVFYSDGAPAGQLPVAVQKAGDPKPGSGPMTDVGVMMRSFFLQQHFATDDQGRFRISGIAPGSYRVAITQNFEANSNIGEVMMSEFNPNLKQAGRLTFYSGNTLHRKDAKMYDVKAGDTVADIEITLPLSGLHSIRGTVAGKDGAPLNSGSLDLADTTDSTITFHATLEPDGHFRFSGIPEGNYQLKASNGRVLENPPEAGMHEEVVQNDPYQFKPLRAFADTSVAVLVHTTDIDDLTVTMPETKLPDPPKQPGLLMPGVIGGAGQVVVGPASH